LAEYYQMTDFADGDVIVFNHPYAGNVTHPNDTVVLMPVFVQGQLVAFTATLAHKADLGGPRAAHVAQDIWEEGLVIPPTKLYTRGKVNPEIERFIAANSRIPVETLGDLRGQVAACRVGAERVQELCRRFGIDTVREALATVRLPVMENDAVLLGPKDRRFWLAGLGDQVAFRLGPGEFRGVDDLPGTLNQVATDDPVVLLVHEPDIFTQVPERVSLTIAGHTHGGQIRLPFVPPVWTPSAYGARFAYGHIVERGRHMIVSGGLGCSKVPLRLGVPPEIVRIELAA